MASDSYIDHMIIAGALILLSMALTWLMRTVRILDVPNHRSSHARPVPSSGGLSIVLTAYIGAVAVYLLDDVFQQVERQIIGLGLAALLMAVAGFLDDLGKLRSFKTKLSVQIFACCLLLVFGVVIERLTIPFLGTVSLGGWGYLVTIIWVLSLTNIFNFMDGLDGLAAGTAILVAAIFGLLAYSRGGVFTPLLCYILLAGSVGFFVFNFPRAKIFMGDVGSQFLGFVFAVIAILAFEYDRASTSVLVMPLLFLHFICDTVFTFLRRLMAGDDVTQAHKKHLYQLMNQLGYSHFQVGVTQFVMVLCQGIGAAVMISGVVSEPGFVILPFFVLQLGYASLVIQASRRRGLI